MKIACDKCLTVIDIDDAEDWLKVKTEYSTYRLCPKCSHGFWLAVDPAYPPVSAPEKNVLPLPVPIGGMIYIPYRYKRDGVCVEDGDEGVERNQLRGYLQERDGCAFYAYEGEGFGGIGYIEVEMAYPTLEAAQARLDEMIAKGEYSDDDPEEPEGKEVIG